MSGEVRKSADLQIVSDGDLAALVRARRLLLESGQDTSAVDVLLGIETEQTKEQIRNVVEGTPAQEPPKKKERRKKTKLGDSQKTGSEVTASPIIEG